MYECTCTQGSTICRECETEYGLLDPVIEGDKNPNSILIELRSKNRGIIVIGHLNINSLRNKFDALEYIITDNIDILVVYETKLDETFPMEQIEIDGFSTPRVDRDKDGGGLILYI